MVDTYLGVPVRGAWGPRPRQGAPSLQVWQQLLSSPPRASGQAGVENQPFDHIHVQLWAQGGPILSECWGPQRERRHGPQGQVGRRGCR